MSRTRAPAEKKSGKTGGADLAQVISLLLGLKKVRLCAEGAAEEGEEGGRAAQERDLAYAAEVAALMCAHPDLFPSFPFSGKALRERLERRKSLDRIVELLGALTRSARAARRSELAQALDMADLAVETLANAQAHADTEEGVRASIGHLAAGPLASWQARAQERSGAAGPGQDPQDPQDPALASLREALRGGLEIENEIENEIETEGRAETGAAAMPRRGAKQRRPSRA